MEGGRVGGLEMLNLKLFQHFSGDSKAEVGGGKRLSWGKVPYYQKQELCVCVCLLEYMIETMFVKGMCIEGVCKFH